MVYRTHLTVLEQSAALYSSAPAFRIPRLSPTGAVDEWDSISYSQFLLDVQRFARHWASVLSSHNLPRRSIVGLWLGGTTYLDVLHVYGIARAGYIPQLFSLRLPSPDVVYELLHRAGAQALIFDPAFESIVVDCAIPAELALDARSIDVSDKPLPPIWTPSNGDDVVMIYHTSGSTSGSPKLVPCTADWVNATVDKAARVTSPRRSGRRDVTVWIGSMSHIGQTFMLMGFLQHGACTVQPSQLPFPSSELLDMVHRCGLNRLNQFASFLGAHLRAARTDGKLLAALQSLDELLYTGLALGVDEETWAREKGILIKNCFGSTEVGAMLLSVGGRGLDANQLQAIEGTDYTFVPASPSPAASPTSPTTPSPVDETKYTDANSRLLELVILPSSGDCPHPSLRAPDGLYRTGDLFLEVAPGRYVSRGRDDDWIKSANALRCDTRAVEDNVRATCADLVGACIVVGNGRPSPALFVEPKAADAESEVERLKAAVLRRTRHFHSRRYMHERIVDPALVFVVSPGTLPRTATKGNIRRRAVEEQFRAQLDQAYGAGC
ncbi:acetyl-CoA synthetase-like protein [Epithele typhae]|uniref:acetyl-CoA synthetase-like protein n=1 Tax=Epithele typhae TaxID=378194 RepID=UPI002007315D|nr:acetyl-CoA synthetase-like protein [Epithele typhae]KAH9944100.1 acetyl-CoA synthetase-like protein [Epithele typhae]